jgi:hypothetical protein
MTTTDNDKIIFKHMRSKTNKLHKKNKTPLLRGHKNYCKHLSKKTRDNIKVIPKFIVI